MISFYFKGGHRELGCEFLHKSFREYLFAEGIVETLKNYAGTVASPLPERNLYWKDFDQSDPRFTLTRNLSELLAAQWLSREVVAHLEQLLGWEIGRQKARMDTNRPGRPTERLDIAGWEHVRDGLAEVWDWWAEGVPLRSQPKRNVRRQIEFDPPYADELAQLTVPRDLRPNSEYPIPARSTTIDAHLGDGLFRLCAWTHYQVALQRNWLHSGQSKRKPAQLWDGVTNIGEGPRRYQACITQGSEQWILFSPSGKNSEYYANYVARINGAGWRPSGSFPLGCNLSGIDLRRATVTIAISAHIPRGIVIWRHANLSSANAGGSLFYFHDAREMLATGIIFWLGMLDFCNLSYADLTNARLTHARLLHANLTNADLTEADLRNADLTEADLTNVVGKHPNIKSTREGISG